MRCMIVSGGSLDAGTASGFYEEIKPDYVIAADRGLEACDAAGIRPDLILGDFDSVSGEIAGRYGIVRAADPATAVLSSPEKASPWIIEQFPPEKDLTDTELAVERAVAAGADEIWLTGATGTRLDHVLANFGLLYRLLQRGVRAWIIDANNRIYMDESGHYTMHRSELYGKYISFLPYGGAAEGLTLKGMKYPLSGRDILPGEESLCVSNEIADETAEIIWESGTLIIIESWD